MTKSELKEIINECIEERYELNSITEDTELEIVEESVKDVLAKIKKWIKGALLKLIRGIKSLLSKGKDNSVKTKLKELLDRAEKALTKSDDISTPEEAKSVAKEVSEMDKEFEECKQKMEKAKEDLNRIKDDVQDTINSRHKYAAEEMKKSVNTIRNNSKEFEQTHKDIQDSLNYINKELNELLI